MYNYIIAFFRATAYHIHTASSSYNYKRLTFSYEVVKLPIYRAIRTVSNIAMWKTERARNHLFIWGAISPMTGNNAKLNCNPLSLVMIQSSIKISKKNKTS